MGLGVGEVVGVFHIFVYFMLFHALLQMIRFGDPFFTGILIFIFVTRNIRANGVESPSSFVNRSPNLITWILPDSAEWGVGVHVFTFLILRPVPNPFWSRIFVPCSSLTVTLVFYQFVEKQGNRLWLPFIPKTGTLVLPFDNRGWRLTNAGTLLW